MTVERNVKGSEKLYTLLKESIPNRFLNLSPHDFEKFISQMFQDLDFTAEMTKLTGDFGADIILKKADHKIAVQVKRYDWNNRVGVKDINQAIGAKDYYGCDDVIVITTSEFTDQGIALAKRANVQLWNWDRLHQEIKNLYLGGKSIYEFFGSELTVAKEPTSELLPSEFEITVSKIKENTEVESVQTKSKLEGTVIFMKMKNNTSTKKLVRILRAIIIDVFGNQFEAAGGYTGSFLDGDVYPKASVPINVVFYSSQIPNATSIKQIIIKYAHSTEGSAETKAEAYVTVPEEVEVEKGTGLLSDFI